jgi:hypothetical protein
MPASVHRIKQIVLGQGTAPSTAWIFTIPRRHRLQIGSQSVYKIVPECSNWKGREVLSRYWHPCWFHCGLERGYRCSIQAHSLSLHGVAWLILECARRTSTFLSCAFREQEGDQAAPPTHSAPNVRSKKVLVSIMCCWMSDCKSRAPARQSSLV